MTDDITTRGLANEAYVSEAWFERERERVFAPRWAAVAFADDAAAPGDATPIDFMGAPLLLTRDEEGRLRVFHNVCRHRGHKLIAEPRQGLRALRCPYHAWAYGLDGRLRATPRIGGPSEHVLRGFDPAKYGLIEARSAVFMGVVMVNLDGTAEPFEAVAERLAPRIEGFDPTAYVPGGPEDSWEIALEADWKLGIENFLESYHLPTVHPALNENSRIEDHYQFADDDVAGQGSLVYRTLTAEGGEDLPLLPGVSPAKTEHAVYPAIYPNLLLGVHADQGFAILVLPLGPGRCVERVKLFYVGEAGARDERHELVRRRARAFWRGVFAEDVGPVEAMQAGRRSPGFDGGVLTPVMDAPTAHFAEWIARVAA